MITHAICRGFSDDLLDGTHGPDDEYYLALYGASADLGPETKTYMTLGEIVSNDYKRGGVKLERLRSRSAKGAHMSFRVPLLVGDIAATGGLIYNKTRFGRALFVLDFGRQYTSTAGPFEITLPPDLYTLP